MTSKAVQLINLLQRTCQLKSSFKSFVTIFLGISSAFHWAWHFHMLFSLENISSWRDGKSGLPLLPTSKHPAQEGLGWFLSESSCYSRFLASLKPSFLHTDVFIQGNTLFLFSFLKGAYFLLSPSLNLWLVKYFHYVRKKESEISIESKLFEISSWLERHCNQPRGKVSGLRKIQQKAGLPAENPGPSGSFCSDSQEVDHCLFVEYAQRRAL